MPSRADGTRPGRRVVPAVLRWYGQGRERLDRTTGARLYRRGVAVDLVDQATVLAAQAFLVLLPALVTLAAVVPLGAPDGAGTEWARRVGLSAAATRDLQQLLPPRATVHGASTTLGVLLTLLSAYSWPKALQRGYETVWGLPPPTRRMLWQRSGWLLTFVLAGVLAMASLPLLTGRVRGVLLVVIGLPLLSAWSWWTQHLLLGGRLPWGRLLPGAVATGVGLVGLRLAAGVYLSYSITQSSQQYGPLGTAFVLLTWLVALDVVLLGGALLGAVLAEHRAHREVT